MGERQQSGVCGTVRSLHHATHHQEVPSVFKVVKTLGDYGGKRNDGGQLLWSEIVACL